MLADHRQIVGWVGFINPASRPGNRTCGVLGWWSQPSLRSCPDTSASGRRARGFRRSYKAGPRWHHVATATPASPMPADHRQRFLQLALDADALRRSEEHTSELQSLMRISYAVFRLKKKQQIRQTKQ